jgi:hypothetical protein
MDYVGSTSSISTSSSSPRLEDHPRRKKLSSDFLQQLVSSEFILDAQARQKLFAEADRAHCGEAPRFFCAILVR